MAELNTPSNNTLYINNNPLWRNVLCICFCPKGRQYTTLKRYNIKNIVMRKLLLLIPFLAVVLSGYTARRLDRSPAYPSLWYRPDSVMLNPYLTDSISLPNSYTMMMVYRPLLTDSVLPLWAFVTDSNTYTISTNRYVASPLIYTMYHTLSVDTLSMKNAYLFIGAEPDTVNHMLMYETAYFPISLTRPQALMFQTYLALRHGITLSRSDYLSTQGTVIWDARLYKEFYHHIQGVGSDPLYHYQATRSVSKEDSLLFICSEDTLPAFSYALLGDNNAPLDWISYEGNMKMLQRRWMLHRTGDIPSLSLSVSSNAIGGNNDTLLLAVLSEEDELVNLIPPRYTDSAAVATYTLPASDIYFSFMSRPNHTAPRRSQNSKHSSDDNATDTDSGDGFSLTPTITRGSFTLDMTLASEKALVISIHDAAGKLVQRHIMNGNTATCKFSGFISGQGTYVVTVSDVHNTILFNQQIIVY